jgi:hypothetical protein
MDHCELSIYLDLGYPRSYHDISIFHQSNIHKSWRYYFIHTNEYFEYLSGNLGYMGEDMFVMHHIKRRELVFKVRVNVVKLYNKIHAWRIPNSSKDPNVGPSRKQQKKEESGHVP